MPSKVINSSYTFQVSPSLLEVRASTSDSQHWDSAVSIRYVVVTLPARPPAGAHDPLCPDVGCDCRCASTTTAIDGALLTSGRIASTSA